MKKQLLAFISLMVINTAIFAQETASNTDGPVSKKGIPLLPKSGDFAIGFGANNILGYAGNFFNGTTNNSLNLSFLSSDRYLYGKYFLTGTTAVRGKFRIGMSDQSVVNNVVNDLEPATDVEDKRNTVSTNIYIGGGLEKRIGRSRIQGVYGGEISLFSSKDKEKYKYGNEFSLTNTAPTTTVSFGPFVTSPVVQRVLEQNTKNSVGFGLRGFAGVEFFVAPGVSIGGEFGWGIQFSSQGSSITRLEEWDNDTFELVETEEVTEGTKNISIDTDNMNRQIYILFHFGN